MFKDSNDYEAKSAGVMYHPDGGQVVTQELIDWADRIFVMDERNDCHLSLLRSSFDVFNKDIYVLDILDIYHRGNPTLVKLLEEKLRSIGGIKI